MFFPLRDYLPKHDFPLITSLLIAANVFIYFVATGDPLSAEHNIVGWGVIPFELSHGGMQCVPVNDVNMTCGTAAEIRAAHPDAALPPAWQTIIASMFLHSGLMHLLGNMLFLFVFGRALELALGRFNFAMFYFFGGLFAVTAQFLWDAQSPYPMVGASGAIAAVLAGYLVLFPSSKILALFIVFPVKVRAFWVLGSWIVFQLFDAWVIAGGGDEGGVAVFAHIGGFFVGVGLTYLLVRPDEIAEFRQSALRSNEVLEQPPMYVPVQYAYAPQYPVPYPPPPPPPPPGWAPQHGYSPQQYAQPQYPPQR